MNQNTIDTLNKLLSNIEAFKKNRLTLKALIDIFEECIDDLSEELPEEFYDAWNKIYDELEIIIGAGKADVQKDEVLKIVGDLQGVVEDYLE